MLPRLLASTITSIALMQGAAFAQNKSTTSGASMTPGANQSTQSLPQEIKQKLQNQGFSDVQVVPGSLLVSAKDKQGDPVTMIIGPNSMTVFTMSSTSENATTGSGGQPGSQQKGQSSGQK